MNFEESSLYIEVKNILKNGSNPVFDYFTAQVHLKNQDLDIMKIVSIDIKRDYEMNFTDEIILTALIPLGQYAKRVYPERNNLEITIKQKPMQELGSDEDTKRKLYLERYIAVLINQGNPIIEGNDYSIPNEDALDLSSIEEVTFQLIPKAVDLMRMTSVGSVYRNANPGEVVKTILTIESQSLKLPKELLPIGVNMVPPNDTSKRDHVVVPHGVKLVDVPSYVHNHCAGIYTAGMGFYYQDKLWYLYPIYNTERFEESQDKVTIINVPDKKLVGVERTYRKDGSNIVILATGETQFRDNSDQQQLSDGNGVRFADASRYMDGFIKVSGNRAVASRGENVNEVMSTQRLSGNQNVHVSDTRISSNNPKEYSKLAMREGSLVNLTWENADPDLIYPGLPVKILYFDDGVVREIRGVVLKAHVYVHMKGQVMFTNMHHTNIGLSIFVNRKKIVI